MISFKNIQQAQARIKPFIHQTPVFSSSLLNSWLGHDIFFKAECLQKVGAFKARGGCNAVAHLVEKGQKNPALKPRKIVANSSGNHAQAVAWSAQQFHIPATIYMPSNVSKVKAQATKSYGAEIILADQRAEVDAMVEEASKQSGTFWIPPYDHDDVIAGQGTVIAEALIQPFPEYSKEPSRQPHYDAIFAPCGGGGLISGSFIASRHLAPTTQVIGVEPALGNDASRSRQTGTIQRLTNTPGTLADGARTLSISERTFHFIKQLDGFYEVDEAAIIYWSQWLAHLLKLRIEPTSAMTMDGVMQWLHSQSSTTRKKILVVLSGGNIDQHTNNLIWQENHLSTLPADKYA